MAERVITEWSDAVVKVLIQTEAIVNEISRLSALSGANTDKIDDVIEATEPGQRVDGTPFQRTRAKAILALFADFQRWSATPIVIDAAADPDVTRAPVAIILGREQ